MDGHVKLEASRGALLDRELEVRCALHGLAAVMHARELEAPHPVRAGSVFYRYA